MYEIKFRAWSERDKEMSPIFTLFDMDKDFCIPWKRGINGDYNDEKCPLMQFTGLKDENGTDIYEGDIVECEFGRWPVIFKNGVFMPDSPFFSNLGKMYVIVIGNIYKNQELLKSDT